MTSTYVDTSTLIKFIIAEAGTSEARSIWHRADSLVSVAPIRVEARAALAAAHRAGRLDEGAHLAAKAELAGLLGDVTTVEVTDDLLMAAADLAESEALRGYDAIHLAAAIESQAEVLTSADTALCDAARRHGFVVANPLTAA